ncbi:deoxyribose-phosphate aldolase [Streptococcus catagoni]|uniref:deoxyribose-phosphate aldolase n=1 Tax=Streptococcus catagoni TaxID=2654874 RepID=UPI00140CF85D|nr:deoxyribose-phosphate aldolase [Streptococcus catagoni]
MEIKEILSKVDHTLLSTTATWTEIKETLDDAMFFKTASACIPPSYVKEASQYVAGKLTICTVIGFPNGYNTSASKVFETKDALANGAEEIDMVINLTDVKNGNFKKIEEEIIQVREACQGYILKVIVETALLTDEELVRLCDIVTKAGADFIKTSTGFAKRGASFKDVEIMTKHIGTDVQIKAAGGITSIEDAEKFISLGASRLGTSRIIKVLKQEDKGTETY